MMHVCGKCKACKPKTKEFFYFARGIVNGACKECRKAANKKNAKEKRELKAKQSRAGFTCCECGEKRDSWLLHSSHGKTRCKICKAYRDHRRTKAPLPFVRFEIEWLHLQYNKKLMAAGFKRCTQCSQVKPFTVEHFGSSSSWCKCCKSANERERATPEKRQKERQKAAEKAGRVYVPGGLEARAAFDKAQRMNAHVVAYRKHIERLERHAAKPWTAAGLSDAEAYRVRYRLDAEFQIKERLRRQMNKRRKRDDVADMVRAALKRDGNSPRAESLLGYGLGKLRQHLERQFTKGMTWDRFLAGDIHIDHIIPQASFNLSDPDEWKQCWCLSNLRPMWAGDNLRKSARVECLV